jgi:hypothetical protein
VISGCAKDIVEHIGVPRLLFNNFPLGNAAGLPGDPASQVETAKLAMELLVSAKGPRTTVQSPLVWNGDPNWQADYSNAALLTPEQIAERRVAFEKGKQDARRVKEV